MNVKNLSITKIFDSLIAFLKRYKLEIFLVFVLIIFSFLVLKISTYSTAEPTKEAIDAKTKEVAMPEIDKKSIDKIKQLEDQNIQVQTLFKEARDNPFSE